MAWYSDLADIVAVWADINWADIEKGRPIRHNPSDITMSDGPPPFVCCLCVQEVPVRVGSGRTLEIRHDGVGRWPTVIFLPTHIKSLDSRGEDPRHNDGAVFRVPTGAVMRVPKEAVFRVPSYGEARSLREGTGRQDGA